MNTVWIITTLCFDDSDVSVTAWSSRERAMASIDPLDVEGMVPTDDGWYSDNASIVIQEVKVG
jgi:hypothetical protein